jgi:uncharacterized repeat protein (TIGR04076 family)
VKVSEEVWDFYQKHLGYTDEEMKKFRENPRNADMLSKPEAVLNKTIVAEVVESHGCNSGHKAGDKFIFDGSGNLLTALAPKRVCVYAMNACAGLITAATELLHAGVDPNNMRFKRAGCVDVGLQCDGWGHIVVELRVEERKKA